MVNNLVLIIPEIKHKKEALEFIKEFMEHNSKINGTGGLYKYLNNYDGWLKKLEDDLNCENNKADKVPSSTYFTIRKNDDKIVGMINIRHKLNDYLLRLGGHIGYSIRPTERRKGYATEMLYLGLEQCKELNLKRVLITCDKNNIASAKTIINNNGELENEIEDHELAEEIIQRYWIKINE
jgi:predicted acetyltransferase